MQWRSRIGSEDATLSLSVMDTLPSANPRAGRAGGNECGWGGRFLMCLAGFFEFQWFYKVHFDATAMRFRDISILDLNYQNK